MQITIRNMTSTFLEVQLKSGAVSCLPGGVCGPFDEGDMTPELEHDIWKDLFRIVEQKELEKTKTVTRVKKKTTKSDKMTGAEEDK